jgi:hypothetical protein
LLRRFASRNDGGWLIDGLPGRLSRLFARRCHPDLRRRPPGSALFFLTCGAPVTRLAGVIFIRFDARSIVDAANGATRRTTLSRRFELKSKEWSSAAGRPA